MLSNRNTRRASLTRHFEFMPRRWLRAIGPKRERASRSRPRNIMLGFHAGGIGMSTAASAKRASYSSRRSRVSAALKVLRCVCGPFHLPAGTLPKGGSTPRGASWRVILGIRASTSCTKENDLGRGYRPTHSDGERSVASWSPKESVSCQLSANEFSGHVRG